MSSTCPPNPVLAQDWSQIKAASPVSPYAVIADATLGATTGVFDYSTNYANTATWIVASATLASEPVCVALQSDNQMMVANAASWNFLHKTADLATTLPPELRRYVFLRSNPVGVTPPEWQMQIPLALGAPTYTDVQISILENAGNGLINTNAVPVIRFTGSFTGNVTLSLTLLGYTGPGPLLLGIRLDTGAAVSMLTLMCKLIGSLVTDPDASGTAPSQTPRLSPLVLKADTHATGENRCATAGGVAGGCYSQNTLGAHICEQNTGWYTIGVDPHGLYTLLKCTDKWGVYP